MPQSVSLRCTINALVLSKPTTPSSELPGYFTIEPEHASGVLKKLLPDSSPDPGSSHANVDTFGS